MKFSLGLREPGLNQYSGPASRGISSALNGDLEIVNPERDMKAEIQILEAQYEGLQALVGELLVTNQQLRMQLAEMKRKLDPTATATHPQSHPGH
jgi:hypothetical protein